MREVPTSRDDEVEDTPLRAIPHLVILNEVKNLLFFSTF